ncbi:MAG: bile acid:sodium symporter [Sedimenticolaceae bacterium]
MIEILGQLEPWLIGLFLVSNMLAIGLGLTMRQIRIPLQNPRLVLSAAITSFIIVPLLAVGVGRLLDLAASLATGLLVLGLSAGAPFMPNVAGIAKGDAALSAGLVVLLMVGTTMYMPFALPQVVVGAQVDSLRIARFLILLMLLPLAGGLILKARKPMVADKLRPILERVSTVCVLAAIIVVMTVNFDAMVRISGSGAISAALLFTILSALAGWSLGAHGVARRSVLGLGAGFRNVPVALIVSLQNFEDPDVSVMIIITTFVALLTLVPAAWIVGRRKPDA